MKNTKHKNSNNKIFDKEFRTKIRKDPSIIAEEMYSDYDVKVVTNTKDTTYVIFPSDMSADLSNLQAGVKVSTAGSAGSLGSVATASTFGATLTSTASSAATASSIGTVGSAGSVDVNG